MVTHRTHKQWTKEEDDYIRNNYKNMSRKEISNNLNTTRASVDCRLWTLCLKHNPVKYITFDEIEYIKNNYHSMSNQEIGKIIGKKGCTVKDRLQKLNLKRTKEDLMMRVRGKPKKYNMAGQRWRKMVTVSNNKRVLESHYVWCTQPGNLHHIPKGFVIHHYNGDYNDNSPDNLLLISRTDHNKFHNEMSRLIRAEL